jgi:predicted enzyme related to lactoylglutathione lyase
VLPYTEPGVGGALLAGPAARPGAQGVVVYLDGGARLEEGLARLARAGGQILTRGWTCPTAWAASSTSRTAKATAWACTPPATAIIGPCAVPTASSA